MQRTFRHDFDMTDGGCDERHPVCEIVDAPALLHSPSSRRHCRAMPRMDGRDLVNGERKEHRVRVLGCGRCRNTHFAVACLGPGRLRFARARRDDGESVPTPSHSAAFAAAAAASVSRASSSKRFSKRCGIRTSLRLHLLHVGIMLVVLGEAAFVVGAEGRDRAFGFAFGVAQAFQSCFVVSSAERNVSRWMRVTPRSR